MPKHTKRRRGGRAHPDANPGVSALLSQAEPIGHRCWLRQHGRKQVLTFCAGLGAARTVRASSIARGDTRPINVYPCTAGPEPCAEPEQRQHWHVGHLRPERARTRHHVHGVTLA